MEARACAGTADKERGRIGGDREPRARAVTEVVAEVAGMPTSWATGGGRRAAGVEELLACARARARVRVMVGQVSVSVASSVWVRLIRKVKKRGEERSGEERRGAPRRTRRDQRSLMPHRRAATHGHLISAAGRREARRSTGHVAPSDR